MVTSRKRGATGVFQIPTSEEFGPAAMVLRSLRSMEGVKDVVVNYITDKVYVGYDPARVSAWRIRRVIADAGVRANRPSRAKKATASHRRALHHE